MAFAASSRWWIGAGSVCAAARRYASSKLAAEGVEIAAGGSAGSRGVEFGAAVTSSTTKASAAKERALEAALLQIEKSHGSGSIMRLGDNKDDNLISSRLTQGVIPTGCLSLDAALGIGGVPRGRVVEVFGPEASGKVRQRKRDTTSEWHRQASGIDERHERVGVYGDF